MPQENLQLILDKIEALENKLVDRMDIICKNINYRMDELKQTDHKYEERIRVLELDNAGAKATKGFIMSIVSLVTAALSVLFGFLRGG